MPCTVVAPSTPEEQTVTMNSLRCCAAVLSCVGALASNAQVAVETPVPRHGDHPAIVVQRLQAQQGYDYASKFYPHPAWLYLRSTTPSDAQGLAAQAAPKPTNDSAPPTPVAQAQVK
jgi:hypothetical protein